MQMVWVTRGDYAGRWMQMTNLDASAAIDGAWANAAETTNWKATDAVVIGVRDAAIDQDSMDAWIQKTQTPGWSIPIEESGTTPPINVTDIDDLTLSPSTVANGAAVNTTVGTLSTSGGVATYTYTLVNNEGGLWNLLAPNTIRKTNLGGYSVGAHSIVVKTTDTHGHTLQKTLPITVT